MGPAHPGEEHAQIIVDLGDGYSAGVRAHNHAGQDVTKDERLPESLGNESAHESGNQNDGNIRSDSHGSVHVSVNTLMPNISS